MPLPAEFWEDPPLPAPIPGVHCVNGVIRLTSELPGALQAEIKLAIPGDVIEICTNATYSAAELQTDKPLTIRPGKGWRPRLAEPSVPGLGGLLPLSLVGMHIETGSFPQPVIYNDDGGDTTVVRMPRW